MRCFLAIPLPAAQKQALADLQHGLRAPMLPVSWVQLSSMHLTLRFLGDISESTVAELQAAGKESFASAERCILRPAGLGCFPNMRQPAVLWVGLETVAGDLQDLQQRATSLAKAVGLGPEKKPFYPHLTLARLRMRPWKAAYAAPLRQLQDAMATLTDFTVASFTATSVVLYKSTLRREGALHEALMEFPLNDEPRPAQPDR